MNVLYLTHRLPYQPNRGDRIRAYYMLRQMATFARVSVFSFVHDDEEAASADRLPGAAEVEISRVNDQERRILVVVPGVPMGLTHFL